jgi:phosphoserine phosphatase
VANNNIKLVTIDGDGCLFAYTNVGSIFHSSWDALGFAYDLKERWDVRTKFYYAKKGADQQWAIDDVADLTGRRLSDAANVLYPVPYSIGVKEFLAATKGKLIRGLLSSCVDLVGQHAATETEMEFIFCNRVHHRDGVFTVTLDYEVPTWEKHLRIPEICAKYNVTPEEICHIGDNENDISVFERVGLSIAFNPKKPEVAKMAKHTISDFRELNPILGI